MMHRISSACALLASCCAVVAAAEVTPVAVPPVVLTRTQQPPVIDGLLDDACWQAIPAIAVDHGHGANQPRAASAPALVRYAWDEHCLYLAYETNDRNLVAIGSGEDQGPAGNRRAGCSIWKKDVKVDVVEFFIGVGDPRFFWELHHNALNQFNDVWCVVTDPAWPIHQAALNPFGILFHNHEYIEDDGAFTFACATTLKPKADGTPSTVGGEDADSGYRGELRIPWKSLGVAKERLVPKTPGTWKLEGLTIALLTVVQDGDLPLRYYRSGPFGGSSWFHHDEKAWPRFVLKE